MLLWAALAIRSPFSIEHDAANRFRSEAAGGRVGVPHLE
jgi:hypothetical protein